MRRSGMSMRNTVERCTNRLKQWRGIATRYEKTVTIYLTSQAPSPGPLNDPNETA